jgi:hypothetical protein
MIRIDDWKMLVDELAKLTNSQTLHPQNLFRGQGNTEWSLEPSFTRIVKKRDLNKSQALQLEREAVNKFSISGSKLLPLEYTIDLTLSRFKSQDGAGIDFMGWFVVMQHHGAPTRTLDWSCSPWAALYFACCEQDGLDGALWITDFAKIMQNAKTVMPNLNNFNAAIGDVNAPDVVVATMTYNTNQRIESQQGRFTICTNPLLDHKPLLEHAGALQKIEIPKELKHDIMIELAQMNISAKTLFPGIDGLGRSVTEYCNLWDSSSKIE